MNNNRTLFMYFSFSILGALLLLIIVMRGLTSPSSLQFQNKLWLASSLFLCSLIGISFTIRPNWMKHYFQTKKKEKKLLDSSGERCFQGHHPTCATFQNHTIHWKGKILCAGCFGLLLGLCISVILTIVYTLIDVQFTKMTIVLFFSAGLLILLFVYIEIFHRSTHAALHVFINTLMPLGFFSITIAVAEITSETLYGLFSILLCFLWLDTRIQLSKWRHKNLCLCCTESCKMFP